MTDIYQRRPPRDARRRALQPRPPLRRFGARCAAARAPAVVADNQPYFVSDETDYTIPHHGEARGLPHVEIEIRQDLITEEAGQFEWARRICRVLQAAEAAYLAH